MKNVIDRREFIKRSIAAGAAVAAASTYIPTTLLGNLLPTKTDISVVNGANYFESTLKSVEILGGMDKFVSKGSKVGLLINSPWNKPGTYTNPDVALAVLKMCIDAGAKEIYSIENASTSYWKRSSLYENFEKEVGRIQTDNSKTVVKIDGGESLKEAKISKALLDCDVFINIPIIKHHGGARFTANLKNVMGACSRSTNRSFHSGGDEFLSQCIADLNLIRQPNLCIVDATEFITTNGPAGPGDVKKVQKVAAGTNNVSVDAYCMTLLGLKPDEGLMIQYANKHGLGENDLTKLTIKEV